jgi:ATP-binding cassette subfamily B protein
VSQIVSSVEVSKAPALVFKDITFRYRPEGPDVLSDINLSIPTGKTVAIVGQTGSGKSTIARLLVRLYEPQSGSITIDGKAWDQIPVDQLRSGIAYVDQTPFIFSAEIDTNLRLGKPGATPSEIASAAYAACFDKDIAEFPEKYQTLIGERGVTLSGGQQQRLTLARALIIDAPVLVLDDALSAVDSDTEAEIISRLKQNNATRTTLLITHRLAAVSAADLVVVLEKGRIVELGSPTELLDMNGVYADMFRRQRLSEEIEASS